MNREPTMATTHASVPSPLVALPQLHGPDARVSMVQPYLTFENNTFYDYGHTCGEMRTLIKPFVLSTSCYSRAPRQVLSHTSQLTIDEDITGILMRSQSMRVVARFCQIQPPFTQPSGLVLKPQVEDCLPQHLTVTVNHEPVDLPCVLPSSKPFQDGRRAGKVVDITPWLKICPDLKPTSHRRIQRIVKNVIKVTWVFYRPNSEHYCMGIYLMRKNEIDDFMRDFYTCNRIITTNELRLIIQRRLGHGAGDEDIVAVTQDQNISLECPLLGSRIKFPVRTAACSHLQSFCLHNFLQMNEQKPFWKCSLCRQRARIQDLFLDQYMLQVLQHPSTQKARQVLYKAGGTWTVVEDESDHNNSTQNEEVSKTAPETDVIDLVSSDEEEENTENNKNPPLSKLTAPAAPPEEKSQVITIVLSDSETSSSESSDEDMPIQGPSSVPTKQNSAVSLPSPPLAAAISTQPISIELERGEQVTFWIDGPPEKRSRQL